MAHSCSWVRAGLETIREEPSSLLSLALRHVRGRRRLHHALGVAYPAGAVSDGDPLRGQARLLADAARPEVLRRSANFGHGVSIRYRGHSTRTAGVSPCRPRCSAYWGTGYGYVHRDCDRDRDSEQRAVSVYGSVIVLRTRTREGTGPRTTDHRTRTRALAGPVTRPSGVRCERYGTPHRPPTRDGDGAYVGEGPAGPRWSLSACAT